MSPPFVGVVTQFHDPMTRIAQTKLAIGPHAVRPRQPPALMPTWEQFDRTVQVPLRKTFLESSD
jgi:hypothetical protein